MNRTNVVLALFVAAVLAGLFLRYNAMPQGVPTKKEAESSDDESTAGKETFFQREIGMPLDMQAVEGLSGVAGYNGTPPLLGSEPKPTPERPYDMANDNELFQFQNNRISSDCCPSPFTTGGGCVCLTDSQLAEFASRGGNRSSA